ncbi:MAG: hypothetical protein OEY89_05395 [Gammaproteobacteria bacterium]|nr:hypothetical protein [Gammaproteobacteria bacterium]
MGVYDFSRLVWLAGSGCCRTLGQRLFLIELSIFYLCLSDLLFIFDIHVRDMALTYQDYFLALILDWESYLTRLKKSNIDTHKMNPKNKHFAITDTVMPELKCTPG